MGCRGSGSAHATQTRLARLRSCGSRRCPGSGPPRASGRHARCARGAPGRPHRCAARASRASPPSGDDRRAASRLMRAWCSSSCVCRSGRPGRSGSSIGWVRSSACTRLLVDREHERALGWIGVAADDVGDLLDQLRVAAVLEALAAVRLPVLVAPHALRDPLPQATWWRSRDPYGADRPTPAAPPGLAVRGARDAARPCAGRRSPTPIAPPRRAAHSASSRRTPRPRAGTRPAARTPRRDQHQRRPRR